MRDLLERLRIINRDLLAHSRAMATKASAFEADRNSTEKYNELAKVAAAVAEEVPRLIRAAESVLVDIDGACKLPIIEEATLRIPGKVFKQTLRQCPEPWASCAPYVLSDSYYLIEILEWLRIVKVQAESLGPGEQFESDIAAIREEEFGEMGDSVAAAMKDDDEP